MTFPVDSPTVPAATPSQTAGAKPMGAPDCRHAGAIVACERRLAYVCGLPPAEGGSTSKEQTNEF
jgi:hypothetical protein